jgi:hypothetical protein
MPTMMCGKEAWSNHEERDTETRGRGDTEVVSEDDPNSLLINPLFEFYNLRPASR